MSNCEELAVCRSRGQACPRPSASKTDNWKKETKAFTVVHKNTESNIKHPPTCSNISSITCLKGYLHNTTNLMTKSVFCGSKQQPWHSNWHLYSSQLHLRLLPWQPTWRHNDPFPKVPSVPQSREVEPDRFKWDQLKFCKSYRGKKVEDGWAVSLKSSYSNSYNTNKRSPGQNIKHQTSWGLTKTWDKSHELWLSDVV